MEEQKKVLVIDDGSSPSFVATAAALEVVDPTLDVVPPDPALLEAVKQFEGAFRDRSFSGRHPELGKMIKCDGCGFRHRSSIVHERRFAKFEDGTPRIAPTARLFRQQGNPYGWRTQLDPRLLVFMNRLQRAQKTAHL